LVLSASAALLTACVLSGCSSGPKAEAEAVGTAGDRPAIGLSFSHAYLTIENHTGVPLVGGQIEVVPGGLMPPFRTTLSRIEADGKEDLPFNRFRGNDGTQFRRGVGRARRVRITATDINGRQYRQELPFN
jgi:hypothetical protein